MGEAEWQTLYGGKVKIKTPIDMPDDILKDAIECSIKELEPCNNLEMAESTAAHRAIQRIKEHMDEMWEPNWHVIVGRNFGSRVTHETKRFVYFYLQEKEKAVMMYKAGC